MHARAWLVVLLIACAFLGIGRHGQADPGGLVDQDGRPFSLEALRGRPVVLSFVFTHCTSVCPTQTRALRRVRRGLPAALRDRVAFVSVTLDPARDTPPVLKRFAAAQGVDESGWWFVTGPAEPTAALARRFGTGAAQGGGGQIDHRAAVYLLDAGGRLIQTYSGPAPDTERLAREIEAVDRLFAGR